MSLPERTDSYESPPPTPSSTGSHHTPRPHPARNEPPATDGDMMSKVALENAYATCHNVQDLLYLRGFTSKPVYLKTKRNKVGTKKIKKSRG